MYYAHFILNKKGPLAKIWLAAHWDKKLTKAQIYETNIESTIETILEPQMKLALRTSGHLLLGVCRIYSRKVKYLLADCNEAFVKIKLAFRPGLIDLPKEKQQASADAITLPEKFPEFFVNFEDINMEDMDLSKNLTQQARVEDITLKEDFGTYVVTQDDDFGDMGSFGMDMDTFMMSDMERGRDTRGPSLMGDEQNDVDFFDASRLNDHSTFANEIGDLSKQKNGFSIDLNDLNSDLNSDRALMDTTETKIMDLDQPNNGLPMEDTLMHDMPDIETNDTIANLAGPTVVPALFEDQPTVMPNDEPAEKIARLEQDKNDSSTSLEENKENKNVENENTAPADSVPAAVFEKQVRTRRRRKLIIDEIKEIDSGTMKNQLSDTSAILGQLELAPPTRRLMQLKETSSIEKMFFSTSRPLHCKLLLKLYTRNMVTKNLTDLTNSAKSQDKTICTKESAQINHMTSFVANMQANEMSAVEASMNDHQTSKNLLPLADSMIDNDASKHQQNEVSFNNQANEITNKEAFPTDLDEFDQFGGPASIFNSNANLEDMLLDDLPNQISLEMTPGVKPAKPEEEESEEEEVGDKKTSKNTTSPNTSHRKRHYKRSIINASLNKENTNTTTNRNDDEENLYDDTLNSDPSKNLNKRAKTMVSLLNKSFNKQDNVGFFELTRKTGRKHSVQKFYSLLVLKKYEIIDLSQEETYSDIIICKGDKFENFAPN